MSEIRALWGSHNSRGQKIEAMMQQWFNFRSNCQCFGLLLDRTGWGECVAFRASISYVWQEFLELIVFFPLHLMNYG